MRTLTRLAGTVGAAALIAGGVAASPAQARDAQACMTNWHNQVDIIVAIGCFQHNGDDITVKDTWADGFRAVVKWETDYGREGSCHNALGEGWTVICDYNFAEKKHIHFKTCIQKGAEGREQDCTPWTGWILI
ncbi:hypothetical protein [Streptomyces sp. NPDC049881]|uniref:hypothetical protein n=1 Tax=unclassified Streptomyces TaxID=2593676 RepID=UPI00342240AF